MSYPEHSLGQSYPSAEMQSVYSIVPADWALFHWILFSDSDIVTSNANALININITTILIDKTFLLKCIFKIMALFKGFINFSFLNDALKSSCVDTAN